MMDLDNFQRSDSLCFTSPQTAILISLKNRNLEEFENLLTKNIGKNLNVDYLYEDPDNKTLLDVACSSKKNARFVEYLLKHGANINTVNKLHKKSPIHFAVEYSDLATFKLLVENRNTDVNQLDRKGDTALHLAVSHQKLDFVELLLKHPEIEVNKVNRKNQTPLHVALNKNNRDITELFLQQVDIDLDVIRDFEERTCRDIISKKFPDMEMHKIRNEAKYQENLFALLRQRKHRVFAAKAKVEKLRLDDDDGENTYLQYACKFGLEPFVLTLLELGADPNKTCVNNNKPPILIAAYSGYYKIVRSLVDTGNLVFDPVDGENALHAVMKGITTCHRELYNSTLEVGAEQGSQSFYLCLEYLLNNVPCDQLDLNTPDPKGNTLLHYAFKANDSRIIRLLLDKGAYIGHKNFQGEMPVKFMNAETLEGYFNESITTNQLVVGDDGYEIIFNYNLLAPPKQYFPKNLKNGYKKEDGAADEYEIISETEPLVAMSRVSELRPLLKHPLITAFLNLKWYTIRRYFWVNVAFYVTFWLFLTFYVLAVYGPVTTRIVESRGNRTATIDIGQLEREKYGMIPLCFTLFLSCGLFMREFFQFSISTLRYISSFENWIEMALILTAHIILLCKIETSEIRSQLAAVAIFLSWMELVLLIGRHPRVSTYVEMFKVVTWNFLKFLAWYSVLILAFALSFYLLFKDSGNSQTGNNSSGNNSSSFFINPALAIFKSAIMSTGEYDASDIPFGTDFGASHVLFVLFIFLVSIVLFNLLNGLAVSDTQAIRQDAELVGIVCRAKLISYIERMAISDPFPYLNVLEKFACCCCCIPIRRHTEMRKKHLRMFYTRINLFPSLFPDREVHVLVNQDNRIVFDDERKCIRQTRALSNCYGVQEWRINNSVIKAASKVLAARNREADSPGNRGVTQAITNLQDVYENRLITLENASKKAESRLLTVEECMKRSEKKLTEIMQLLNNKL